MNKKIILLPIILLNLISLASLFADEQRRRPQSQQQRQKGLFEMTIEKEKQEILLQTEHKGAAWLANKGGKAIGTFYSLEARITAPLLLSSSSTFHENLFKRANKRQKQWLDWACGDLTEKDKEDRARIKEIAELASWQGHCAAFGHNVEGYFCSLATQKKLNVIKSTNPDSILLQIIEKQPV